MEPPYSVHPIAEWCILGIEVYSGTGQLSFLSPRGGKYIEIPRGARYHHGVLSFGGTYMEVSFDADVATEHGIRAAVVLNLFPFMSLRQATAALRELREGGLIAEREYDGPDPDYRNWYTLTETGNAVA